MVTRLQDENRKLNGALADKKQLYDDPGTPLSPEVDVAVLQRLRNMVDKQREQIRGKDKELSIKSSELETVSCIKSFLMIDFSCKSSFNMKDMKTGSFTI